MLINLPLTDVARAPAAAYMGTLQHMIHERIARASLNRFAYAPCPLCLSHLLLPSLRTVLSLRHHVGLHLPPQRFAR
jgi:hypothetical protein